MKKQLRKLSYIPEILYEAPSRPGEKVSPIPYVVIPKDKDMPAGIYIMRYSQTGEHEVGDDGKPEEIMDGPYPHMFVDFAILEEVIHEEFPATSSVDSRKLIDAIRVGLGLLPAAKAKKEGEAMLDRVVQAANKIVEEKMATQQERKELYEKVILKNDQEKKDQ